MFDTLTLFLDRTGSAAPLLYIALYLMTAVLPFIPTPLVSALGGSFLGWGPAVGYGIVGLGLGSALALQISRRYGRPIVLRFISPKLWQDWEGLLGIRSPLTWGVVFFVLNIDFAVLAAGLTGLRLWKLWLAAVLARIPWLIVSAYLGERLFESPSLLPQILLVIALLFIALRLSRPFIAKLLIRRSTGLKASEQVQEVSSRAS